MLRFAVNFCLECPEELLSVFAVHSVISQLCELSAVEQQVGAELQAGVAALVCMPKSVYC